MIPLVLLALGLQSSEVAAAREGILSVQLESESSYQQALSHAEAGLQLLSHKPPQLGEKRYGSGGKSPIAPDVFECDLGAFRALVEVPSPEVEVCLLMNAGGLYLRQLQLDAARKYYEAALQITKEHESEVRTNLAWLEVLRRRPADARRWIDPSPPVFGATGRTYLVSGVVLRETGHLDEARPVLEKAAALYEESGDVRGRARALAHLGTLHLQARRFEDARASYDEALRLTEQQGDPEARWHALGGLAKSLEELGDTEGSLVFYKRYLDLVNELGASFATDQGKVSFLSNHERVLDDYFHLLVVEATARGRFEEARTKIEEVRARALDTLVAARQASGGIPPGEMDVERLVPETGSLSSNFANMAAQSAPAVTSRPETLQRASAATSRSETPDQRAPAVASRPDRPLGEAPTVEEPARQVDPPPITFLEYFSFPDMTVLFVKSKDGSIHGATVQVGEEGIRKRVEAFRNALGVATPRGVVVPLGSPSGTLGNLPRELYRLLIEPVDAYLPRDPDEVVAIVPHHALWYLPFAALRKNDGTFLVDAHLLTLAASEEIWRATASRVRPDLRDRRAWVVGNPRMPKSLSACGEETTFPSLPGAEKEAKRVAEILGRDRAELFVGDQADRIRLEAWHGAFEVIHLATHGVVCDSDPLGSFLVLTDVAPKNVRLDRDSGTLSLRSDSRRAIHVRGEGVADLDLAQLDLSGILTAGRVIDRFHLDADLVTLSACQTGLGLLSSDGVIGFSRAFLAAGARSLLMSLWRIDDTASRDWMTAYYEAYVLDGNKAKALRRAMAETRKRYHDPRYWAGFGLLGLAE